MKTGWEITPLGWIALILLAGIIVYFVFFYNKQNKTNRTEGKGTLKYVP